MDKEILKLQGPNVEIDIDPKTEMGAKILDAYNKDNLAGFLFIAVYNSEKGDRDFDTEYIYSDLLQCATLIKFAKDNLELVDVP